MNIAANICVFGKAKELLLSCATVSNGVTN